MYACPKVSDFIFSPNMKLCLFHGTQCCSSEALALTDEEITPDKLIKSGVKPNNMSAAGVGPKLLKQIGIMDCKYLRKLGFDALDLADVKFATEANGAFGSEEVISTFLVSASDAVSIAGTEAVHILGVKNSELLSVCAGSPIEARAVLEQLPSGISLDGVSATTLLDTGLRKSTLCELGYSLSSVASQTSATAQELYKLGFSVV